MLNKGFFLIVIILSAGCFNKSRIRNYNWELDSLRYYTLKMDSILTSLRKDIKNLSVDMNIRMDEINEKIDKLNERMKEEEDFISGRIGSYKEKEDVIPNEEKTIYDAAYMNYVRGNYNDALKGFDDFIKKFPESKLSENALLLLGESYLSLGKRQDAIDKFLELIKRYPNGKKVPTALFKIGIIYESANDMKNAKFYFEKVIIEYPDSPEASLAKSHLK